MWIMAFLQSVHKDLQQSLAEQQHLALLHVLRERGATITFDDIQQLLGSALGKRLGPLRVTDVLGIAQTGEKPKAAARPRETTVAAKPARPKRRAAPKAQETPASTPPSALPRESTGKKRPASKKKASRTKKGSASKAKASTAAAPWSPPGMSPKRAAALARYSDQVLARLTEIGDWTPSEAIRKHVGGSSSQLLLALKKLQARGNVVFQGERQHRLYKVQTA
jgi:hypothetical protein